MTFVASLLETLGLRFAIDVVPKRAMSGRPALASLFLAMDLARDRFPGDADDTILGGDGQKCFEVLGHDDSPTK
jgi:hypothetical protein